MTRAFHGNRPFAWRQLCVAVGILPQLSYRGLLARSHKGGAHNKYRCSMPVHCTPYGQPLPTHD